jgi:hypothetical protein
MAETNDGVSVGITESSIDTAMPIWLRDYYYYYACSIKAVFPEMVKFMAWILN